MTPTQEFIIQYKVILLLTETMKPFKDVKLYDPLLFMFIHIFSSCSGVFFAETRPISFSETHHKFHPAFLSVDGSSCCFRPFCELNIKSQLFPHWIGSDMVLKHTQRA